MSEQPYFNWFDTPANLRKSSFAGIMAFIKLNDQYISNIDNDLNSTYTVGLHETAMILLAEEERSQRIIMSLILTFSNMLVRIELCPRQWETHVFTAEQAREWYTQQIAHLRTMVKEEAAR